MRQNEHKRQMEGEQLKESVGVSKRAWQIRISHKRAPYEDHPHVILYHFSHAPWTCGTIYRINYYNGIAKSFPPRTRSNTHRRSDTTNRALAGKIIYRQSTVPTVSSASNEKI